MIFFYKFKKLFQKLSIRASVAALIAIFSAMASSIWGYAIPDELTNILGANSVDNILHIIASNMLVVVTFSLATMVAGYTSASQGVTPRAARILIENQRSENAISIFLGAFIFSIVSIAALSTEFYSRGGRFILFVLTCFLIFTIVWTFIRWIEDLSKLGRVHETIIKIEKSAQLAFKKNGQNPNNFCKSYVECPVSTFSIQSQTIGYVQSIDYERLNVLANKLDCEIYIKANPGSFVHKNSKIIVIKSNAEKFDQEEYDKEVNKCFVIDDTRSLENDPRFNVIVLSEVASRALSTGVNDPGTAIDALRSVTKVFHLWINLKAQCKMEVKYSKIFVKEVTLEDCFNDFFIPISRDASEYIEVLVSMLKTLNSIIPIDDKNSSLLFISNKYKKIILNRGLQSLKFGEDKALLQKIYDELLIDKSIF